ncbi:MAG: N-acetylglucosaminyl-diphospho-decaprenol L-rhamnosyltransferase [Micromonosporaceae bacterium]
MSGRHSVEAKGGIATFAFASFDETVDCTAVIVTYNSAADITGLLDTLPAAAAGLRVRVVVVDNDSADDIAQVISRYPGVMLIPAGGNLGYAGGINVGRRNLGDTRSVLILNPDLQLAPGSLRRLADALGEPGGGAAVPRFLDEHSNRFPSLRREPTVLRALGDALLGKRWPDRPAWLSEMVWGAQPYQRAGTVDWATGAVMMISTEADGAIGDWDDDRFFLYSEETDYCRRLRDAGYAIRYVPDATVRHEGGGSGTGADLYALNSVNRVRYYAKYHSAATTALFRLVVVLHEALRATRPASRRALRALLWRRNWASLPGPRPASPPAPVAPAPAGTSARTGKPPAETRHSTIPPQPEAPVD